MVASATRGLVRDGPGKVWKVRRVVPGDLQHRFGKVLKKSTGTADSKQAQHRRDDIWAEWNALFDEARLRGEGAEVGAKEVAQAISAWRRERCDPRRVSPLLRSRQEWDQAVSQMLEAEALGTSPSTPVDLSPTTPPATSAAPKMRVYRFRRSFNRPRRPSYFDRHPDASTSTQTPDVIRERIARLERACLDPNGWTRIAAFDEALDAAVLEGGLECSIPVQVRPLVRRTFAEAWLEVTQIEEHHRLREALNLAVDQVRQTSPQRLVSPPSGPHGMIGSSGLTLSEAVESYRQFRAAVKGEAPGKWERYNHANRVMLELFGSDRPIRDITSDDALGAVALLRRVPPNATKKYPGRTLAEAAEEGAGSGAKVLASHTLNNLIFRMGAVFKFAIKQGQTDRNPFAGLAVEGEDETQRRAFSPDELRVVFGGLGGERLANSARWWVPAMALYQGARLNEIAQLRTTDIGEHNGIPFISVTEFDDQGKRVDDKSLKNKGSQRVVPIHPALLKAGFLDFVAGRRADGSLRLFPELKFHEDGGYGRALSRWFGRYLDKLRLTDRALVFHSFRHGWSDACRRANIPERIQDAMGGWEVKGQAGGYGDLHNLPVNLAHLSRVEFGSFSLQTEDGQ